LAKSVDKIRALSERNEELEALTVELKRKNVNLHKDLHNYKQSVSQMNQNRVIKDVEIENLSSKLISREIQLKQTRERHEVLIRQFRTSKNLYEKKVFLLLLKIITSPVDSNN
jgi:predicted RNase H-like nuclease (RuvC/YqgF family)